MLPLYITTSSNVSGIYELWSATVVLPNKYPNQEASPLNVRLGNFKILISLQPEKEPNPNEQLLLSENKTEFILLNLPINVYNKLIKKQEVI